MSYGAEYGQSSLQHCISILSSPDGIETEPNLPYAPISIDEGNKAPMNTLKKEGFETTGGAVNLHTAPDNEKEKLRVWPNILKDLSSKKGDVRSVLRRNLTSKFWQFPPSYLKQKSTFEERQEEANNQDSKPILKGAQQEQKCPPYELFRIRKYKEAADNMANSGKYHQSN